MPCIYMVCIYMYICVCVCVCIYICIMIQFLKCDYTLAHGYDKNIYKVIYLYHYIVIKISKYRF